MRRISAIFWVVICLYQSASAQNVSGDRRLEGSWLLIKGQGGPCVRLIRSLEYSFRSDGSYTSAAEVATPSGWSRVQYSGSYRADGRTATALAAGTPLGPYPYRFEDDVLIIEQPEFGCSVELSRTVVRPGG